MKKQTRQEYRTARQSARQRTARAVLSFLAFVVLVGAISAAYYWRNSEPKIPDDTDSTTSPEQSADSSEELGSAVFFLYLKSEREDAHSGVLLTVNADAATAQVKALSRKQLENLRDEDGLSTTSKAHESLKIHIKTAVDRVILLDERGFKDAANALGGLDIFLDEQTEFVWDGTRRTLHQGRNLLRGESLLRYLQYATVEGDTATQQALWHGLAALTLSPANRGKGEILFSRLINMVKSDISAMDFVLAGGALDKLARDGLDAE
ncbi:MAG: hypothetical protein FWG82_00125 [Oscillospiraceae bacterium]|nr:hypothetical protein [Oscillospiraceae bacterium]